MSSPYCVKPESQLNNSLFLRMSDHDDYYMEARALAVSCDTVGDLAIIPKLSQTQLIRDILNDIGPSPVWLNLNAPFSVLAGICTQKLYAWLLRNPNEVHTILGKLTNEIAKTTVNALRAGVVMVSFADPLASVEVLGARHFKEFVSRYQELLVKVLLQSTATGLIHLCPYGFNNPKLVYKKKEVGCARYDKILLGLPYTNNLYIVGSQCPHTPYTKHLYILDPSSIENAQAHSR